jgi:predicted DNA-binding protein
LSPRTGRPTTDPKSNWTGFRLSDNDIEKLNYCAKETGMSKAEIVRKGIEKFYNELLTHTKDKI